MSAYKLSFPINIEYSPDKKKKFAETCKPEAAAHKYSNN